MSGAVVTDAVVNEILQIWLGLSKASCQTNTKGELQEDDDGRPLYDYLLPKEKVVDDIPSAQPKGNWVKFLNLKNCYEKIQTRRDGISAQRPMDCRITMLVNFDPLWTSPIIDVFVQRHPESARLCGDLNGKVKLQLVRGNKQDNKEYIAVNLDSVYKSRLDTPVYKLSTVDPLRRNRFILIVRLSSGEQKQEEFFTSPPFQVRSRRPSRDKILHFKPSKRIKLAIQNKQPYSL